MKSRWTVMIALMILPLIFSIISCSKQVAQSQAEPPAGVEPQVASAGEPDQDAGPQGGQFKDGAAALVAQHIHFDFDKASLSFEARRILNDKAAYLHTNPFLQVTIEGHCDARGTDSYNMALGERRAEMVKKYLIYQGVGAERIKTTSYGEERPFTRGQDESSWALNRRAQFTIN